MQQAVEKGLKAYHIIKELEYPERSHSLILLGERVKLPDHLLSKVREINPDYIYTRYLDVDGVTPYDAYDKHLAEKRLRIGLEVMEWLKNQING